MEMKQPSPQNSDQVTQKQTNYLTTNTDKALAAIGVILLFVGQYILSQAFFPTEGFAISQFLNGVLRFDLPNTDNVLIGLSSLLPGCLLITYVFRNQFWPDKKNTQGLKSDFFQPSELKTALPFVVISSLFSLILLGTLYGQENHPSMKFIWLAAIISALLAAWRIDQNKQISLSPSIKRVDAIWILIILIVGLVVGGFNIQGYPRAFMGDEGDFWVTARDIANGIYVPNLFEFGVYSYPILSSVWQALIIKIFGATLWSWRFSSLAAGVLALIPIYFLARELYNRKVAVIGSFSMIFLPYFLAFARLGYNNIQTLFPIVLGAYWVYLGIKRNSVIYLLLAGMASGLGFYTYTAGRSAFVIIALFFLFLSIKKTPRSFVPLIKAMLTIGFGFMVIAGPHLFYGFVHHPESLEYKMRESLVFQTDFARMFFSDAEIFTDKSFFWNNNSMFFNLKIDSFLILRGFARTLLNFQIPDLTSEHFIFSALAGAFAAAFYLVGLADSLYRFRERRNALLLAWFLVSVLALSTLNTFPPRHTHMVGIIPLIAIWIGYGIDSVSKIFSRLIQNTKTGIQTQVSIVLLFIVGFSGAVDYFVKADQIYRPSLEQFINWAVLYQPGIKAYYIYQNAEESEFVPYIIRTNLAERDYQSISFAEFQKESKLFSQQKASFYFPPQIAADVFSLADKWTTPSKVKVWNREGDIIGGAVANFDVSFFPPTDFGKILLQSFPPHLIAVISFLLISIVGLIFVKKQYFPKQLRKFANWLGADVLEALEETVFEQKETRVSPLPRFFQSVRQRLAEIKPKFSPKQKSDEPEPVQITEQTIAIVPPTHTEETARTAASGRFIEVEFRLKINLDQKSNRQETFKQTLTMLWQKTHDLFTRVASAVGKTKELAWEEIALSQAFLVVTASALALMGQYLLSHQHPVAGEIFYGLGALSLLIWLWKHGGQISALIKPLIISRRAEWILVAVIFAIALFSRFFNVGNFPYGIEGDESKWGLQAFYSTILRIPEGQFQHHFQGQPVSFYLIGLAMRLFGINLISQRILNAALSSISVMLFYFLQRRITNKPVALLGTLLYALSFTALNAGRQALHDTHIEIFIILSAYFLVLAVEKRKAWFFFLTGIFTALGTLTYETFYSMIPAILLFLAYLIIRQRGERKQWLGFAVAFAIPLLAVTPTTLDYFINSRQGYHFEYIRASFSQSHNLLELLAPFITNFKDSVSTLFVQVTWTDSLLRWDGPFINPFFVPFFLIGFLLSISHIQKNYNLFLILWFVLGYFGFGTFGANYPRVMFVALMPIFYFAATGIFATLAAFKTLLQSIVPEKFSQYIAVGFLLYIFIALSFDVNVFSTQLYDMGDRKQRRELIDTTRTALRNTDLTIFPIMPGSNDVIEQEIPQISMAGYEYTHILDFSGSYIIPPFEATLGNLGKLQDQKTISIIFDKSSEVDFKHRQIAIETILACYPNYTKITGAYFDWYTLKNLDSALCYSLDEVKIINPLPETQLLQYQPVVFDWEINRPADKYQLIVERQNPKIIWVEAETIPGDGWFPESTLTSGFIGTGFLTDNFQAGLAETAVKIPETGLYNVWVRTYRRQINDQTNFITLNNGEPLEIATAGQESFGHWIWEKVETLPLAENEPLTISLTRTYGQDAQYSVFIDTIVITSEPDFDPLQQDEWDNYFNSGVLSNLPGEVTLPGLTSGNYRWKIIFYKNKELVDWQGNIGFSSDFTKFTIQP
jgi:4-amino-4-deoxy-L-arabinose transferase-like glycosyltransferase